jgi:hypothetical protein
MNRNFLFCLIFILLGEIGYSQSNPVTVYTTAEKTDYRIAKTGTVNFADFGQPNEGQVCVFVDPTHSFQTILGIGGALTDASAETFAKLSPTVQKSLLTAYYDKDNGIGYTLARTNIHSCDFSKPVNLQRWGWELKHLASTTTANTAFPDPAGDFGRRWQTRFFNPGAPGLMKDDKSTILW